VRHRAPPDIDTFDIVVLGSGSAGLAAALTTSAGGLSTAILEKSPMIGGTTALSGAVTWVPANHHARAAGLSDSAEDALDYLRAASPPGWRATEEPLWRAFVDAAPRALTFLEAASPLRFSLCHGPDPLADLPGAKASGRTVTPLPLRRAILDSHARALRPPMLPHLMTNQEAQTLDAFRRPRRSVAILAPRLAWRWLTGVRTSGTALIIGLLRGCLDHGCCVLTDTPAVDLLRDEGTGAVTGVVVAHRGVRRAVLARRGVVLASGGFEWDNARLGEHFPGATDFITSPRTNTGDAHRMAERAGAALAHMDQANLSPAAPIRYDGATQGISLYFHREPNAIVVDRSGRRFANEYHFNLGEIVDERDPNGGDRHLPAWLISDRAFLARQPLVRRFARVRRDWLVRAGSLAELARRIAVPVDALVDTIARFNGFCASGVDADFHRERVPGGPAVAHRLAAIGRAPFLAIPFSRSFVSTKGGPRTDARGQVLRPDGSRIAGLYCAGVAMANPIGTRAVGAGTTIGPNLTWGFICGESLLASAAPRIPTNSQHHRQEAGS
jgi:3-oxosteroid 1-dehydrogenase